MRAKERGDVEKLRQFLPGMRGRGGGLARVIAPGECGVGQGAEEILKAGAKHFEFTGEELRQNRRGAWRRSSVAWAIARETSVLQE